MKLSWSINNFNFKLTWWLWLFVVVFAFFIQLLTLDVLPHLQQDEAQITDYGRLALNPRSDWSVTWVISQRKPLLLWSYLGPLIAEVSFHLAGPSGVGPRISSIVGGMVAASMLLGWLLARKTAVSASVGLSIAFLLDPLFVLSQRIARVDSWVFASCIAACWILTVEANKESKSTFRWRILVAGGLAASAAFIWPSAIFLYPLIGLELFGLTKANTTNLEKLKGFVFSSIYFLIGVIIIALLFILPFLQNFAMIFGDMNEMVSENIDSTAPFYSKVLKVFDYQSWLKLIKAYTKTFSPIFPVLGLFGALFCRDRGLIFVTIVTVILIFSTLIYEFRVLYLLPYFIILFSNLFKNVDLRFSSGILSKGKKFALIVTVIWAIGISLVARTALGIQASAEMDRDRVKQVLLTSIGEGEYSVFLDFTYEFYFAGRSLGWKLYTPYIHFTYDDQGNWLRESDHLPKDKFLELLSQMDYAIFYQGSLDQELKDQLTVSGLYFSSNFEFGNGSGDLETASSDNRAINILRWFLQGKQSYGSYAVYARKVMEEKHLSIQTNEN